jgi:hypothetical protein
MGVEDRPQVVNGKAIHPSENYSLGGCGVLARWTRDKEST